MILSSNAIGQSRRIAIINGAVILDKCEKYS